MHVQDSKEGFGQLRPWVDCYAFARLGTELCHLGTHACTTAWTWQGAVVLPANLPAGIFYACLFRGA